MVDPRQRCPPPNASLQMGTPPIRSRRRNSPRWKIVSELVFADVFSAFNDATNQRRAVDELYLETLADKTLDDDISKPILASWSPSTFSHRSSTMSCSNSAFWNAAVGRQMHVSLAPPAKDKTLTTVISDMAGTDNSVDMLLILMDRKPVPSRVRPALLTPEVRRSSRAQGAQHIEQVWWRRGRLGSL